MGVLTSMALGNQVKDIFSWVEGEGLMYNRLDAFLGWPDYAGSVSHLDD